MSRYLDECVKNQHLNMLDTFILFAYMCFCVVKFLHMYAFCSYWFMYISAYLFVNIYIYMCVYIN